MASPTRFHKDYSVAWICALPLELAAAKAVLDETHSPLPQPPTDQNAYTLGSLNGHLVVIACLPSGVYGTTSAATVLAQMRSTFPNLHFALMVGIGGGVPNDDTDIRLGDVVVSKPTGSSSGIIQYDYGKAARDGQIQRTGSLNKPPLILLTAMAQIESDHMIKKKNTIAATVLKVLETNHEMGEGFSRPRNDLLFLPTYSHKEGGHKETDTECWACDRRQLVGRPSRDADEPHVHYGAIASGNRVIKDAQTRDRLAQELGILCFEMEAAGLMDQLPCLVIRGICDYCDSHKHKKWQGYASLTAAAYARTLLSVVPINALTVDDQGKTVTQERIVMIPFQRNLQFVGRQDELTKIEKLISLEDGPRKIAITGLGGMGKTQVALELAYRVRDKNESCSIFWISSVSQESVEQGYMSIANRLKLQGVNPANVKTEVQSHLSEASAGQWLLICDNADDMDMWIPGSTTPAMDAFLPQSPQGRIVFTTRNRRLAQRLAQFNVISLAEMDVEMASEMLMKSLNQPDILDDVDVTNTLLRQLTFLPLAITQAAAYINSNGIEIPDYLALLQEQEENILELLSEDFGDEGRYAEIQNPVATTWLISFHQIRRIDPLAIDYLSFMACINPRNIPQSLLPAGKSPKKKIDALGLLNAYSFTSTQKDGSLSLHRLVHLATRNWIRRNNLHQEWIQRVVDRFDDIFPNNEHGNRSLWRMYLPHVLSLLQSKEFDNNERSVVDQDLIMRVGQCLFSDGRYNDAEPLFNNIVGIQRQIHGDTSRTTLTSVAWLASTYRNQGRWKEAEELDEQIMMTNKTALGMEHPETLTSMIWLASTYRNQGRWAEAEKLEVHVMETRERLFSVDHPDTLSSMANLASTYRYQGRWAMAERLEMQVVEADSRMLGPEHPDTLTSKANLALTYWKQGRWTEAEELGKEVLEASSKVLGAEHPETLTTMANLALTYWDQGRWAESEELGEKVMNLRKKVLGPEHPDTLISMANLALTYRDQGHLKKAEELGVQVWKIRRRVLGLTHPSTLNSMHNLAYSWDDLEKFDEATRLMRECFQLRTQYLGPNHPETLLSKKALRDWGAISATESVDPPKEARIPQALVVGPPISMPDTTLVSRPSRTRGRFASMWNSSSMPIRRRKK